MIPIRDNVKSRTLPFVTWALIAANIFVFVYELSLPGPALDALSYTYGLVPARYPDVVSLFTHPAILTSMFLHAGPGHLVGNLLYLFIFGDNVEDWLGRGRYLVFYLACGVVAALAQYLMDPATTVPMVGASGAMVSPSMLRSIQEVAAEVARSARSAIRSRQMDHRGCCGMRASTSREAGRTAGATSRASAAVAASSTALQSRTTRLGCVAVAPRR